MPLGLRSEPCKQVVDRIFWRDPLKSTPTRVYGLTISIRSWFLNLNMLDSSTSRSPPCLAFRLSRSHFSAWCWMSLICWGGTQKVCDLKSEMGMHTQNSL